MSPMIDVAIIDRHPCSCSWPECCGGTEERRCQSEGCQCKCGCSRPCEGCAECPPEVCPGCHAVVEERHAPDCIDEEIGRAREDDFDDDRPWDEDDEESESQ